VNWSVQLRDLGVVDYTETFAAMQRFTAARADNTPDEVWLCEHPAVFTQGLSGKPEHLLSDIGIPVAQVDRGGQITYHGPGQVVAYLMLDLRRRGLKVREFVTRIEQAIIDTLAEYLIVGERNPGAPGVYVAGAKIAALGLRIKHGCSYHGLSLNVAMDLSPYRAINPCGYAGLAVTQLRDLGVSGDTAQVATALTRHLETQFP
jgi:lipoyl(octanoyl) transferase